MSGPTSSDDVWVAIDRVRVTYGSLVAVRDLSLELRGGDLLGLIGPNGAGKTTLLRAVAGLLPLACGQVRVMGEPVEPGRITVLSRIGFTPDEPSVYPELTVREFLHFIGLGYDLDRRDIDERIDFWLDQVWLTGKADQKIKALSRGMRQRIGIARTLLPNPAVILLDEPAAGLDPAGRVQFRQLMSSLRDQGKALIISSHILADLNEFCTHIGIIAHGSLMQYGTVAQVAEGGNHERCRYTILLTRPVPDLARLLAGVNGIAGLEIDRDRVTLEYGSEREAAARLLAELVRREVPVASFSPNAPGLEEAYLRTGIRQVD